GSPSWLPSIVTFGQLRRKYSASAHDVICEQWVRPSHRNALLATAEGVRVAGATGTAGDAEPVPHAGSPAGARGCMRAVAPAGGACATSVMRDLYWSNPTRATAPRPTSASTWMTFMRVPDLLRHEVWTSRPARPSIRSTSDGMRLVCRGTRSRSWAF